MLAGIDLLWPWRKVVALYRRPAVDRRLFWRALCLLLLVRLSLRVNTLETVRRRLRRLAEGAANRGARRSRVGVGKGQEEDAVERVPWAVDRAAWLLPGTRCLPRALVGQALLASEAQDSRLRVGAKRDPFGRLRAHAWIEKDDRVLIGGGNSPLEYQTVPLSLFDGAPWRRRMFSERPISTQERRITTGENEDGK